MPKLFVFAIGGTGERVLRSFTMLLASGAPTFDNYEVYPVIIDYDKKNADKDRTVALLKNYSDINIAAYARHSAASNLKGQSSLFFASKLRNLDGLDNYVFPFHPATPNEKFRDYIGYDQLEGGADTSGTAKLLKSLFDESNRPDTELNLNIEVGFKGNPNIGSVVFHTINNTKEFAAFKSRFQPEAGDKVVVIGSLFGGTGASGIPEIVKAIAAMKNNAKIATILVLPYFAPMEQNNAAIRASRFNSKTKAAITFYQQSGLINDIDKVYYVGDPYPTTVKYCDGGQGQKNNANIVELIAAMMIEHYVAGRNNNYKEFKFSPNANIVVTPNQKGGQRLFIYDFDTISINKVLNHLVALSLGLKLFGDAMKADDRPFYKYLHLDKANATEDNGDTTNALRNLCMGLKNFSDKYQEWLKELDFEGDGGALPANSHRMAICDMTRSYSDIIMKEAVMDDGPNDTSTWERIKGYLTRSSDDGLTKQFMLTRMNAHFEDTANGDGHYDTLKNEVRVGHEHEWVFADLLYKASWDGLNKLINN